MVLKRGVWVFDLVSSFLVTVRTPCPTPPASSSESTRLLKFVNVVLSGARHYSPPTTPRQGLRPRRMSSLRPRQKELEQFIEREQVQSSQISVRVLTASPLSTETAMTRTASE